MKAAKAERAIKPKYLLIKLGKLFLNVSFNCKLSALVETDIHKKTSSSVAFSMASGEANFNQNLRMRVRETENLPLGITVVIIKGGSKKKVGIVRLVLDHMMGDRGLHRFAVEDCPQKNVYLEVGYAWESDDFAAKRFSGKLQSKTENKKEEKKKEHVFNSQKGEKFQRKQVMPPKRLFHTQNPKKGVSMFSQKSNNSQKNQTPMKRKNYMNFKQNLTPLGLKLANRRLSGKVAFNTTPKSGKRSQYSARSQVKIQDQPPKMISTPIKEFSKKFPTAKSSKREQNQSQTKIGINALKKSKTDIKNQNLFDDIFSNNKNPVENIYDKTKIESFNVKGEPKQTWNGENLFEANEKSLKTQNKKDLFDSDDIFSVPKVSSKPENLSGSGHLLENKNKAAQKSIWNIAVKSEQIQQIKSNKKDYFKLKQSGVSSISSAKNESIYSSDIRSRNASGLVSKIKESVFDARKSNENPLKLKSEIQISREKIVTSREQLLTSSFQQEKSATNLNQNLKTRMRGSMRISIGPKMGASIGESMGEGFYTMESSKTEKLAKLDKLESHTKDLRQRMKLKMRSRREASREQKIRRYANSRSRSPGQSIKLKFGKSSRALSRKSKGSLWGNGKDKKVNLYQTKEFKLGGQRPKKSGVNNKEKTEQMSLRVRRNQGKEDSNKDSGLGSDIGSNLNSQKQSECGSQKAFAKSKKKTKTTIFGDFLERKPKPQAGNMSLQVEPGESRRISLGQKKRVIGKNNAQKLDNREGTPDTGVGMSHIRTEIVKSKTIGPSTEKLKVPHQNDSYHSQNKDCENIRIYSSQSNNQTPSIQQNYLSNEPTVQETPNQRNHKRKSLIKSETGRPKSRIQKRSNLAIKELEERFKQEKRKWELQKIEMQEIIQHLKADPGKGTGSLQNNNIQIETLKSKVAQLQTQAQELTSKIADQELSFNERENSIREQLQTREKQIQSQNVKIEEIQTEKELIREFLENERKERNKEREEEEEHKKERGRDIPTSGEGFGRLNRKIKVLEEQNRRLMEERREWKKAGESVKQEPSQELQKLADRVKRLKVQNEDFEQKVKEFMCKEVELRADLRTAEEMTREERHNLKTIEADLKDQIQVLKLQVETQNQTKHDYQFEIIDLNDMTRLIPLTHNPKTQQKSSENNILNSPHFHNLKNENTTLKQTQTASEQETKKLNKDILKIKQKVAVQDLEIQDLRQHKSSLEQKMSRLGSQTLEMGELERELKSEIERVRAERDKTEEELRHHKNDRLDSENTIASKEQLIREKETQIEHKDTLLHLKEMEIADHARLMEDKDLEIRENENYIKIIERKLESKTGMVEHDISELKNEISLLKAQNEELKSQKQEITLEKENSENQSKQELSNLESAKSNLESEIENSKTEIQKFNTQIAELQTDLTKTKNENTELKLKLTSLEEDLKKAQEKNESVEYSEYEKEKMKKASKILEIKVANLKGDLRSAEKARQLAEKEKEELNKNVTKLESKLVKAEEVRRLLEKGFTKSKSKIGNVLSQLNSMKLKSKVRDQLIELLVDYN